MSSIKFVTEGMSIPRTDLVQRNQFHSINEAKRAREEEWKKVYENKENPPPVPEEEVYDPRTLYERLQEQKQKKDDAHAEATKFGNLIHRIDNDEFDFLNTLEHEEAKKKKDLEEQEQEELKKFRQNVQLKAVSVPTPPSDMLPSLAPKATSSQFDIMAAAPKKKKSLFAGLVKRDDSVSSSGSSDRDTKAIGKRKAEGDAAVESSDKAGEDNAADNKKAKPAAASSTATKIAPPSKPNALLALAAYESSSDEDD
ncbi:hypothetical protein BGZ83_001914 [Gryganskiella cystojenkinii]|nr:hypothetical protein BGZ83_001914 [Gryganskiella cystojenkinii]